MVVLSIDVAQPLRVVKLRFNKVPVNKTDLAVAYLILKLHSFFVNDQDTVVGGVRNHQKIMRHVFLPLNAKHFAWVLQILVVSIFNCRRFRHFSVIGYLGRLLHFFGVVLERWVVA